MTPTNNFAVRTQLLETDDSGTQQTLKMSGRKREMFGGDKKKVLRIQSYGMSSHAPDKSQAVTTTMGGNPDQLMILGLEHPDSRPKDQQKGEVQVYDDQGQKMHLKRDILDINTPKKLNMQSTAEMTIKSDNTITITRGDGQIGTWPDMAFIVRKGDTGSHGGSVSTGSPTWHCMGAEIARKDDTYSCAIHGDNLIVGCSSIWRCDGRGIARHGDATECGASLIAGQAAWDCA